MAPEGGQGEAQDRSPLVAIVGPTASGKTQAAIELAERLRAEVVSVDSMVVYRGMDVGTAKPTSEQRARVPHHLLDVAEPGETFSVAAYQVLAADAVLDIRRRGSTPLLVGGSGLYFRAVVDGLAFPGTDSRIREALEREAAAAGPLALHHRLGLLDPGAAGRIEPRNARRTVRALEVAALTGRPFSTFSSDWNRYPHHRVRAAGVELAPQVLRARIEARVRAMMAGGLLDEVRELVDRGLGPSLTASQAIGYAEMAWYLAGRMSLEDAVRSIVRRTRSLARRQLAWFRRDPRIAWFSVGRDGAVEAVDEIERYLRTGVIRAADTMYGAGARPASGAVAPTRG
jgi:tRNA dimethylallyltransferase